VALETIHNNINYYPWSLCISTCACSRGAQAPGARHKGVNAIMVGGMPMSFIIRAAQYTPMSEANADKAHDDSSAPSIGDDASVENAPFDDDSGDQLQSDPADDTTDETSDDGGASRNYRSL
jgi:hypothetical protein